MPFETLYPKPSASKTTLKPEEVHCRVRSYVHGKFGLCLTLGVGLVRSLDVETGDCMVQIKVGTGPDMGRLHLEKVPSGGWKLAKPRKDGCRSIHLTALVDGMVFGKLNEAGIAVSELVRPGSGLKPILKVTLPATVWKRA